MITCGRAGKASIRLSDQVTPRLDELRGRSDATDLDRVERAALHFLAQSGIEDLSATIHYTGADRYQVWAADSMVFTARALRAGDRNREALRGWGQVVGYRGQCGGFLPSGLSDHVGTLQNMLERLLP